MEKNKKNDELVVINQAPLSEGEIQEQVNLIQRIMKKVMQKDVHFGVIPGCGNKPTLLKAGAEKLLSTFRIGVDPVIEDLSGPDEVNFRVIARGIFSPTGNYLGSGVGCASSNEEKYKWRGANSTEEFENTPETRRRIKFAKGGKIFQVRQNPSDVANTILKMAKKRAQIDMTLTVLAASDIFTQDIEEMEDVENSQPKGKPIVAMPKAKAAPVVADDVKEPEGIEGLELTPRDIFDAAEKHKVPLKDIKAMMMKCYKKENTEKLTQAELFELIEWIKAPKKKAKVNVK